MLGQQRLLVDDFRLFERDARVGVSLRDRPEALKGRVADFDVIGAEGLVGFGGAVDGRDGAEALFFFFFEGREERWKEVEGQGRWNFEKRKRSEYSIGFLFSLFSSRSLLSLLSLSRPRLAINTPRACLRQSAAPTLSARRQDSEGGKSRQSRPSGSARSFL